MAQRIGGSRRKSRHIFTKPKKNKGKISITSYLRAFEIGERVRLSLEPAIQKGVFNRRFVGKVGTVKARQGRCYMVTIKDINKVKDIIVHPVHLKKEK